MGLLERRLRRLETKLKPPLEAVRVLVTFVQPDGSEGVPHMLLPGGGVPLLGCSARVGCIARKAGP
jgi:hypothetical protein